MINKIHITVFAVITVLYLLVAIWKYAPDFNELNDPLTDEQNAARQTIVQFWDVYNTATSYRVQRNYEQAADYYSKALELNSRHEDALYYLGSMHLFLRNFEKTEKYLQSLEEIIPNSPRSHLQLGTLYYCMDDSNELFNLEKAKQRFETAWELNREETGTPLLLSKIALLEQEYEKAYNLLDIVTASNTMSYQAIFLSGYINWLDGIENSGISQLQKAINTYQNLAYAEVQGEGTTETGARAMLSEDRFCDPFEIEIERLLENSIQLDINTIYSVFNKTMNRWRPEHS